MLILGYLNGSLHLIRRLAELLRANAPRQPYAEGALEAAYLVVERVLHPDQSVAHAEKRLDLVAIDRLTWTGENRPARKKTLFKPWETCFLIGVKLVNHGIRPSNLAF